MLSLTEEECTLIMDALEEYQVMLPKDTRDDNMFYRLHAILSGERYRAFEEGR